MQHEAVSPFKDEENESGNSSQDQEFENQQIEFNLINNGEDNENLK